jgi:hypothetical protein
MAVAPDWSKMKRRNFDIAYFYRFRGISPRNYLVVFYMRKYLMDLIMIKLFFNSSGRQSNYAMRGNIGSVFIARGKDVTSN